MENKVIIAADSTCDLSPELIEKYNIEIKGKIYTIEYSLNDEIDGIVFEKDKIHHRPIFVLLTVMKLATDKFKSRGYEITV